MSAKVSYYNPQDSIIIYRHLLLVKSCHLTKKSLPSMHEKVSYVAL